MNKEQIKYLVLSDIHLGHNTNKTELITDNLRYYFSKYKKELSNLDIIFIAGDIFDRLLPSSGSDFVETTKWLAELVVYCKTNKIKLRVLEGTPSHDWKQAKIVTTLLHELAIEIDYKYIDTLYIERFLDLGITCLYLPDEYKHKAVDTWKDVQKLLKQEDLHQVDIAMMHGQFHYQLPMIRLESSHNEEDYLSIVKHYISIGHIHTHSVRDRIIAQGSFDRLAHNEEEDKGGVLITLNRSGEDSYRFLVNERAMKFITLKYIDQDIDNIVKDVLDRCSKLPLLSSVRIRTNNYAELNKCVKTFKEKYYNIKFKIESLTKEDKKVYSLLDKQIIPDTFNITRDNIEELLSKEMEKHNLTVKEHNIFLDELKESIKS